MVNPPPSPNHEIDGPEPQEEESNGHPLFPRAYTETGPDRRRFDWIQVVRYLPDGSREVCPKMYKGSELRSWQQILDQYGGECTYQLGAQTAKDHRFTAWSEKCYFASPPRRSFSGGPWVPRQDSSSPQSVPQQQSTQDALVIALVKLLAERRDSPLPPPPNPVEMLREAAALLNGANRAPNPLEMVKEILPLINSGERTSRTLMQGIELARELYKNNPGAATGPSRSSSDDIGDVMNIVKMITAVRPANPPATTTPPAAPQPAPNPPQQQYAFAPPCPPPPGYGWMYTQQGWVAFPMAMSAYSPLTNRPAPLQQPSPAPTPAARATDDEMWLRAMLADPATRAKLQAALASTPNAPVPSAAAPAPIPEPPAASAVSPAPTPIQGPSAAVHAPSPAHALSDMLTASGWSFTPSGEMPAAWHYTKPSAGASAPGPGPTVSEPSSAEQPPENAFEIPPDVPLDDELRAMLAEPEFQELASSLVPPEAQGAFAKLVQKNALQLRETAEA